MLRKIVISMILLLLVIGGFCFAGGADEKEAKISEPVKIVFPTMEAGNAIGAQYRRDSVKAFNEKFKGKYEVVIEEIPGHQEYLAKLKILYAGDNLPAIMELFDPSFAETCIKNDKLVDLKPYIDADPVWKSYLLEEAVEYNTIDGKILTAPKAITYYIGMFYNKELFAQAGIKEFPKTWDAFWEVCEKLKSAGITALSLQTEQNGWGFNHILTSAMAGSSPAGLQWALSKLPVDYELPEFIEAAKLAKKAFEYTTKDAIGGNYPMAANNFVSAEKTAMMSNGSWMIASFSDPTMATDGFADKVGVAAFPGSVIITYPADVYGWAVANTQPKEVIEGAVEYLRFLYTQEDIERRVLEYGGVAPKLKLSEETKSKMDPLVLEMTQVGNAARIKIPMFSVRWNTSVLTSIAKELPLLATGNITAEEYARLLTVAAKKYAESIPE